jgi:hypothetical protein
MNTGAVVKREENEESVKSRTLSPSNYYSQIIFLQILLPVFLFKNVKIKCMSSVE